METLKAYNILFSFTPAPHPLPGMITVVGKNEDDAKTRLLKMADDLKATDMVIHQIVDLENVPVLNNPDDLAPLFEAATNEDQKVN